MDNVIKIYKTPWHDITKIKRFLNEYLMRYRIYNVDDRIVRDPKKTLPIIEVRDELYYNPKIENLVRILSLKEQYRVKYYDVIVMGDSIECIFVLDYLLKHGIDAMYLSSSSQERLDMFFALYDSILKFPNPFIDDHIREFIPIDAEVIHNRYLHVTSDDASLYSRTAFLMFSSKNALFYVEHEDELIGSHIFLRKKDMYRMMKEKRIRNKRKRVFSIVGNHPDILLQAAEVYRYLENYSQTMQFELLVISTLDLFFADAFLLKSLRANGNVRIIGKTHVIGFKKTSYQVLIQTDLLDYTADYILEFNKKVLHNEFMQDLVGFTDDGFLETDSTYKTRYANIYSMRYLDTLFSKDSKVELLDRYIECAQIAQRISQYLERN